MAQAARLAHYELLERDVDASILQLGAEDAQGAGAALAVVGGVPTAVARRVQQSLSLAAKCTELQRKLEAAVAERAQAKTATERLTRELERANQKMAYAQQPYNYLVEVLQNTERKLEVRSQWPVRAPFPQGRCRCPGAGWPPAMALGPAERLDPRPAAAKPPAACAQGLRTQPSLARC